MLRDGITNFVRTSPFALPALLLVLCAIPLLIEITFARRLRLRSLHGPFTLELVFLIVRLPLRMFLAAADAIERFAERRGIRAVLAETAEVARATTEEAGTAAPVLKWQIPDWDLRGRIAALDRRLARWARTARARFVARWLSFARSANLTAYARQLFTASPRIATTIRWRAWHHAHVLPLVLRAAGWRKAQAERVVRATIKGFKLALTDSIATRTAAAEQFGFDDCWPMLECLEELAVHCPQGLHPLFADGVVELTRATQNEAIHAALAWIVNELSERSNAERCLAGTIQRQVAAEGPPASREALRILQHVNRRVLQLPARRRTPADEQWESERVQLFDVEVPRVSGDLASIFQAAKVTDERIAAAREICAPLLTAFDPFRGLEALRAMAAARVVFRHACDDQASGDFVEAFCHDLLDTCIDEGRSVFLTIEAMEPMRDRCPVAVASAMARFLGRKASALDHGIAVCIAEGIEEADAGRLLRTLRFRRTVFGRWASNIDTRDGIEVFWALSASALGRRSDRPDVPEWMNLRLDVRTLRRSPGLVAAGRRWIRRWT